MAQIREVPSAKQYDFLKIFYLLFLVAAFLGQSVSYSKLYLVHLLIIPGLFLIIKNRNNLIIDAIKREKFLILFLVWAWITTIWSPDLKSALQFNIKLTIGFSIMAIISLLFEKRFEHYKALCFLFFGHITISLLESFSIIRLPTSRYSSLVKYFKPDFEVIKYDLIDKAEYPTSFFWHQNNAALVTLISIPFVLNSQMKQVYKSLVWLLSLILIMKCGAKSIMILYLGYSLFWIAKNFRKTKLSITLIVFLILSFVGKGLFLNAQQEKEFNRSLKEFQEYTVSLGLVIKSFVKEPSNNDLERIKGNTSQRILYMLGATEKFRTNPVWGIGSGQLRGKTYKNQKLDTIHNHWLEILTVNGILGFALYFIWIAQNGFLLFRKRLTSTRSEPLLESLVLFCISVPVMSSSHYFLPMWILYSLIIIENKTNV